MTPEIIRLICPVIIGASCGHCFAKGLLEDMPSVALAAVLAELAFIAYVITTK